MMKHFYVTNPMGAVVRYGVCTEQTFALQAGANETVHEGKYTPPETPPRLATGYDADRLVSYPNIGAQLDMIWHSMNNGEIPKSGAFFEAVKAVKDQYPKE